MHFLSADLGSVGSIVSTATTVISIVFFALIAIGILLGLKRGLIHSLLRLGAAILAALAAIPVTRALRETVAGAIQTLLDEVLTNPTIQELLAASPTAKELITVMPGSLAAPLLFFVVFLVMNFIFYMIYKILKRLTVFSKQLCAKTLFGKMHLGRLLGAGVSLVASFIIVVCFFSPFAGYIAFADSIVTELEEVSIEEELDATIVEVDETVLTPLSSCAAFTVSGAITKPIIFDPVMSCNVNGYKVVWSEEVAYLAETYATLTPILESGMDLATFSKTEADALRAFADQFDKSDLLPRMIAELLPAMAEKWNKGETFCGIENPANTASEQLQPLMHSLVDVLEGTTYDTFSEDIHTVVELIATLAESGTFAMLGSDISAQDIVLTLSKPGLISGLIDTLYANERMQVLVTDIANLGFDAISESLAIPENDEAVRAQLTLELNDAVSKVESIEDYDQKIATLSTDIGNIFEKYGVETDKDTATLYAECIVGTGPIATENGDDAMVDYFTIISTAIDEAASEAYLSGAVFAKAPVSAKVKEAVAAYLAAKGQDAGKSAQALAEQIKGSEKLAHAVITLSDIHLSAEEMKKMTSDDIHNQATSLEDIIGVMSNIMVFAEDGSFSIDINKLDANALADALFRLASTGVDSEGHVIHNIAHAITGVVKYSLYSVGINSRAANDLVNHMTAVKEDGTKKNPLSSAIAVLNIVQSDKELTAEDIKQNISTMVNELDKETAKVLSDCISSNLLNSFAPSTLPTEQTDALVNVTKDIITNFGEQAENLSPEQLEAEAAYMQTIFDLAVNAGEEREDSLFTSEENESSTLDMTADDFVDTIQHSTIISNTVINETESLKIAVNNSMPEADKELLYEAIENKNDIDPALKEALLDVFQLGNLGSIGK